MKRIVTLIMLAVPLFLAGCGHLRPQPGYREPAVPHTTDEMVLADAGQTAYRIVIPADEPNEHIARSLRNAAELLQRAFRENGIEIVIAVEGEAPDERPGIYLGKTAFARRQGVDFAAMEGWTYTFRVFGDDLVIAGNDRPDPLSLETRALGVHLRRAEQQGGVNHLATLKGVTEFLYQYAGVRFLSPGANGIEFLATPRIAVPGDLDLTRRPWGRNIEIPVTGDIYFVATGFEPHQRTFSRWGHFHGVAVSPGEFGESNPEYFILRAGKRDNTGVHLCLSNPEVQELIYQKVLELCDAGFDIIEMGQEDGYLPCECEDCHALYGVRPVHTPDQGIRWLRDPAWGEKLWIMHRDMARRLLVDRPGKRLMICAYSVARHPPRTFNRLPENVIVEMMGPDGEIFSSWRDIEVPGGFGAYTYTWGNYAPKNSIRYIAGLLETLLDNGVRDLQINRKPVGFGIEGGNIYAFRRMMNDPGAKTAEELFDEYIEAAYGPAAVPMRRFFGRLNLRLDFRPEVASFGYANRNPLLVFNTLYTPEFINELERHLARAETLSPSLSPTQASRLAATRFEFDYLRHIAATVTLYHAYLARPDQASLDRVLDAVEERNAWLESSDPRRRPTWLYRSAAGLKTAEGLNTEPFNWNTAEVRAGGIASRMEEEKSLTVRKTDRAVTLDSPAWQEATVHRLQPVRGATEPLRSATSFQALYDEENLYLRFDAQLRRDLMDTFVPRGRDAELWLQECLNILLAPEGDRSQYYYLTYEPVADSFIDAAHGFITDPLHPVFGWNDQTWDGEWTYENEMVPEEDRWLSLATIPFATLGVAPPVPGTAWGVNFGRIHYREKITDTTYGGLMRNREMSVWTGMLNASYNPGEASMGDMVFE